MEEDEDLGGEGEEMFKEPHRELTKLGEFRGLEAGMRVGEAKGYALAYAMESKRAFEFGCVLGAAKASQRLLQQQPQSGNSELCLKLELLIKRLEQAAQTQYWNNNTAQFDSQLDALRRELVALGFTF